MSDPNAATAIACPACDASQVSGLAVATITPDGLDLVADCCGFRIWQGVVVDRGQDLNRDEVVRRVRGVLPNLTESEAIQEPWSRRWVLGLSEATWTSDEFDTHLPVDEEILIGRQAVGATR